MAEKDIDEAVEKKFGHKTEMFETNANNRIKMPKMSICPFPILY